MGESTLSTGGVVFLHIVERKLVLFISDNPSLTYSPCSTALSYKVIA